MAAGWPGTGAVAGSLVEDLRIWCVQDQGLGWGVWRFRSGLFDLGFGVWVVLQFRVWGLEFWSFRV